MSFISLQALTAIGAVGAFSTAGMYFVYMLKHRSYTLKAVPVVKSMEKLHDYSYAHSLFGDNIKPLEINTYHAFFHYSNERTTLPIKFKGDKTNGILYSFCSSYPDKIDDSLNWRVDRLDLEIPDFNKRWTFYIDPESDMGRYERVDDLLAKVKT